MSALIVCCSRSHGNTAKVARAIGDVLDAEVVNPADVSPEQVAANDLVGFGSGIYAASFDPELRRFAVSLAQVHDKRAFVFATSGFGRVLELPIRTPLATLIRTAGYQMVGSFCCPGWDTWLPLRLVGGLNKGRPNEADLERAREFARRLPNGAQRNIA